LFWTYIAFSQYLLIWYANIPEETIWYLHRFEGTWAWVSALLLFGQFHHPVPGPGAALQQAESENFNRDGNLVPHHPVHRLVLAGNAEFLPARCCPALAGYCLSAGAGKRSRAGFLVAHEGPMP
jgi:hypothetical protein